MNVYEWRDGDLVLIKCSEDARVAPDALETAATALEPKDVLALVRGISCAARLPGCWTIAGSGR